MRRHDPFVRIILGLAAGAAFLYGAAEFLHAQSSLTTVYTTADAWDCAGGKACPKPIGAVDGSNVLFTLRAAPAGPASVDVYQNGIRQRMGDDYTLAAVNGAYVALTFATAPPSASSIDVRYRENARANILPQ